MEKDKLIKKIEEGLSIRKLSKYFKNSYSSVRYWIKKYNLKTNGYIKTNNWEKDKLLCAIEKSECKSDILRNLNISVKAGNFETLDRYCKKYLIDIGYLKYKNNRNGGFKREKTNNEMFVLNSESTRSGIKNRILKLQLDHINGICNDNRLENLRFLCPNCHSQTKTFSMGFNKLKEKENNKKICICGNEINKKSNSCRKCTNKIKHRKVKNRPEYIELKHDVEKNGYKATGRKYGVADNTIRRWIKFYEKIIFKNN